MEFKRLNNGVEIPSVGYGVYQTPKSKTMKLVSDALDLGYRHIDTAQNYSNEAEVGSAILESGISREDVFVTTKTQTSGYESTLRGINHSLEKFGHDYFDLILIHWPTGDDVGTYHALEDALNDGKCRAIGLSNFNSRQFGEILTNCTVKPAVNQIETHLLWQQEKMHKFLVENNCLHESWSPFSSGNFNLFNNEVLLEIANSHFKSVAQVILRFLIQTDIIVIPKSSSKSRMKENLDVFDFKLSSTEIRDIRSLNQNKSYCNWPYSMQEEI
ncbi:MAG: aldo/keto reductase [Methanobrevibacter sp.]|nr:aldo/keto reductase [Methanobrevibacter sp.]